MKTCALLAVIVIFSAAPAAFAQAKGDAAEGKQAFMQHCAVCHGADGNGKPAIAQALKVTFPPLGGKEVQSLSDAEIAKVIAEGKGKMPAVHGVTKKDVANIIAFIRTLKK